MTLGFIMVGNDAKKDFWRQRFLLPVANIKGCTGSLQSKSRKVPVSVLSLATGGAQNPLILEAIGQTWAQRYQICAY